MTYEMMADIASSVLNKAEMLGEPLFELDANEYFDEYKVSDGMDCEMPLGEFLVEYTNEILHLLNR